MCIRDRHVADAGADIRHRHARLQMHLVDQFLGPLRGIASGAAQPRRNRLTAFRGLIALVGVGGYLRG